MNISQHLDAMRGEIPGCSLVSFGDLKTGLALRTSAKRQHKQDYLEDILQQAALNFAACDALSARVDPTSPLGQSVIVATPDEVRIFIRSKDSSYDVVCCVCDGAEQVARVTAYAQKIFQEVLGET